MEQSITLSWTHVWGVIAGIFGVGAFFYKLTEHYIREAKKDTDAKFDKQDAYMREAKKDTDAKFDKQDAYMREAKKDTDAKFDKLIETLSSFQKNAEHRFTKLEMEAKNTNQRLTTIEGYLVPKKVYHFEEPHKEEPKEN